MVSHSFAPHIKAQRVTIVRVNNVYVLLVNIGCSMQSLVRQFDRNSAKILVRQKWSHLGKNGTKVDAHSFGPHINAQRVDIVAINVL